MSGNQPELYHCQTQQAYAPTVGVAPAPHLHKSHADKPQIVLGVGNIVPRWDTSKGPTNLKWFLKAETFPSPAEAQFSAQALDKAAADWNEYKIGVTFSQTTNKAQANFFLVYEVNTDATKGVFASAFFPNQSDQDVKVFKYALEPANRDNLKAFLLHELGHVFGLRHEFAVEGDFSGGSLNILNWNWPEGQGAVQFMNKNPDSVMSYRLPPKIQPSDVEGLRAFYKLKGGQPVDGKSGPPVTDYVPQVRK